MFHKTNYNTIKYTEVRVTYLFCRYCRTFPFYIILHSFRSLHFPIILFIAFSIPCIFTNQTHGHEQLLPSHRQQDETASADDARNRQHHLHPQQQQQQQQAVTDVTRPTSSGDLRVVTTAGLDISATAHRPPLNVRLSVVFILYICTPLSLHAIDTARRLNTACTLTSRPDIRTQ